MAFVSPALPARRPRLHSKSSAPPRRVLGPTLAHLPVRADAAVSPVTTASPPAPARSAPAVAPVDPVHVLNSEPELFAALERSAAQLVVLRIHARWCRSCRALEPKWRRLAREMPTVHFAELEFEANKPLARRLGVEVMPTFLIYDAELGRVDKFSCGPQRAQVLRDHIETAFDNRRARLAGDH